MSESSWIHRWKNSKPTDPKGPRVMNPSEEIANLRKDPALADQRHPRHADAAKRLAELYHDLYGDATEEDNAT
jgi:hypothetical protein